MLTAADLQAAHERQQRAIRTVRHSYPMFTGPRVCLPAGVACSYAITALLNLWTNRTPVTLTAVRGERARILAPTVARMGQDPTSPTFKEAA